SVTAGDHLLLFVDRFFDLLQRLVNIAFETAFREPGPDLRRVTLQRIKLKFRPLLLSVVELIPDVGRDSPSALCAFALDLTYRFTGFDRVKLPDTFRRAFNDLVFRVTHRICDRLNVDAFVCRYLRFDGVIFLVALCADLL